MKLRTEMVSFHGTIVLVDPTMDEDVNRIALRHDAAVAHALMEALERWAARRADHASYADHLLGHADEIMSGWGFDTGEVRDEAV